MRIITSIGSLVICVAASVTIGATVRYFLADEYFSGFAAGMAVVFVNQWCDRVLKVKP